MQCNAVRHSFERVGMRLEMMLSQIPGIGPARLKALNQAGIFTARDLTQMLPKDYRDLTEFTPIDQIQIGQTAALMVRVTGEVRERRVKKLLITKVFVTDGVSVLQVVWFNQPWLKKQLNVGRELLLYGKTEMRAGAKTLVNPTIEQSGGLIPVYRAIPGLPPKALRAAMECALDALDSAWKDELPEKIRAQYGLCERNFALRNAHFPLNRESLNAARKRLAFEDLLLYQMALRLIRNTGKSGIAMPIPENLPDDFWASLPFFPTDAQRRVADEIARDLRSDRAMTRMVQGDVGCGKTAIAFAAMAMAHACGYQCALMAPTEVLAQQHYESAKAILEPLGCRIGYLTGSLNAKGHKTAHSAIANGEWDIVIGTHALITDSVEYHNLGLVITDEQHRFGVRQRTLLSQKGDCVNVLVMSATPIPRSLSLILYGDLDISIVDELPPGRKPVATRIVPESRREGLYGFLRKEIANGRQAYVVCPLVEESEAVDALPAEAGYEDLRKNRLPDLRIELVHGRMKPAEKDAVLEKFRAGGADVLVSTTVIEVGVNVPNATIMVVENAERFGLAQLHQLRGRVGRGKYESWCFLMAEPNERLRFLTGTNDGFKIAQKDMELRGPGELFGTRQSGAIAEGLDLAGTDALLLKQTHDLARELIQDNSAEAAAIIALTKARFGEKLEAVAVN